MVPWRGRRQRGRLAVIAMVASMLLILGGRSAALAATGGPAVPVLSWGGCGDAGPRGFDCARARVPLDYRNPKGATITLAVTRHRATRPGQRIGALFFNPGGLGGSAIQSLATWLSRFPPALVEHFDLISWDPRGTGDSTPVRCFESDADALAFFADVPIGFPIGPSQAQVWTDAYARLGALCSVRNGEWLEHVSTADSARDLELLRRAVGQPWMNYYGTSYGTFLGATYANLFPGRVRAMVLDGNVDPVAWSNAGPRPPYFSTSMRLLSDVASNRGLNAFLDLCGEAGPARCAFAGIDAADTRGKFTALLERIRGKSIPFRGEPITYAALIDAVTDLIVVVPAGFGFAGWDAAAQILQTLYQGGSGGIPPAKTYDDREQAQAVQCAESPNPHVFGYYRALATAAFERSGDVGPDWAWGDEPCASWPATAADAYRGPWDHRTANPLLVIGTTFDPFTAYEGSVAMARDLAQARLLTVDGFGHTALLNPSTCADTYVSTYFLTGTLPPPGTVCKQDTPPFAGG